MSRGGGGRCCPSGGGGERERARLLPPSSSRSSSCRRLRLLRLLLLLLLLPTPWVGGAAGSTETSLVAARAAGVALGVAVAILRPEAIAFEGLSEAFQTLTFSSTLTYGYIATSITWIVKNVFFLTTIAQVFNQAERRPHF